MALDEREYLWQLREAKRARLQQLELRAAMHGPNTPPEVSIEMTALQRELDPIDLALRGVAPPAELLEELGPVGRFQNLQMQITMNRQRSDDQMKAVDDHLDALTDEQAVQGRRISTGLRELALVMREARQADDERQVKTDAALTRLTRIVYLLIAIVIALVGLVARLHGGW